MMLAANHSELDDLDTARTLLSRASGLVDSSRDRSLRAELKCQYAAVLSRTGEPERARTLVAEALRSRESLASQVETACLLVLASMAQYAGDGVAVVRHASEALARWRAGGVQSPILEAKLLGSLAAGHNLNGDTETADAYYARALASLERLGLARSPEAVTLINNWGIVARTMGNERRALELYDRLIEIEVTDDPDGLPSPLVQANRATTLEMLGRGPEAARAYEAALAAARRERNDGTAAHALLGLARIAHQSREVDAAERYLAQAADYESRIAAPGSSVATAIDLEAANIAHTRNRLNYARAAFSRIITEQDRLGYRIAALRGRAQVFLDEGDLTSARRDAEDALALAQSLQKSQRYSTRTGNGWLMLGRVLEREGEKAGAAQAYRHAVEHLRNTVDPVHPSLVAAQARLDLLQ